MRDMRWIGFYLWKWWIVFSIYGNAVDKIQYFGICRLEYGLIVTGGAAHKLYFATLPVYVCRHIIWSQEFPADFLVYRYVCARSDDEEHLFT